MYLILDIKALGCASGLSDTSLKLKRLYVNSIEHIYILMHNNWK